MLEGMKSCFQKVCAGLRRGSDRFLALGMLALGGVGMIYATVGIFASGGVSVDTEALAAEREMKREAPYRATPLRAAPFAMPEIAEPIFPDRECVITNFGAVPGGKISNTESFKKAIESCASSGGGRVTVPKGLWLSGAIHLKSNIDFHLEKGARVIFSNDVKEYLPAVFSRFEGIELSNYSPFVYARDCTNIAITGEGELDGNGKMWQDWNAIQEPSLQKLEKMADEGAPVSKRNFAVPEDALQPSFIQFVGCRGILIEGVKILASPSWTIHPVYSENIIVRDVEVYTDARNTDGIAIDSSRNVIVQDSLFRAGDDAIVIKSGKDRDGLRVGKPSENIVIHDCAVEDGHGGIALGSEMSGGIRNVFAYDMDIVRSDFALRMKSMRGRGGAIENIFFEDIEVEKSVFDAIQIDMRYGTPLRKDDTSRSPVFRDISFKNITVEWAKSPYFLQGLPESPIRNLTFENVKVSSIRNGKAIDVEGESYKNVTVRIFGE
jgi:polygalacturonase